MKRICMYCEKYMGDKEPLADTSETHGICPLCMNVFMLKEQVKDNIRAVDVRSRYGIVEAYICLYHARIANRIDNFYRTRAKGLAVR